MKISASLRDSLINTVVEKLLIGLLIVLVGFYFDRGLEAFKTQQSQLLETFKDELTANRETATQQRMAVGDFVKELSTAYQAIEWLTWKAKFDKDNFSQADIKEYDEQMKVRFPELARARVIVAAFDADRYKPLSKLVDDITRRDAELAQICSEFKGAAHERQQEIKDAIGTRYQPTTDANLAFNEAIAMIVEQPKKVLNAVESRTVKSARRSEREPSLR